MSHSDQTMCNINQGVSVGPYALTEQMQDANNLINIDTVKGNHTMHTKHKYMILVSIALVMAMVILMIINNMVVMAQEPSEIELGCGVLTVDLNQPADVEPTYPPRDNRSSVTPQSRGPAGTSHQIQPDWQHTTPPCPQWKKLRILS